MVKEREVRKTEQKTAAKKILGCSSTASNAVLRAELEMHPLKTET